MKTFHKYALYGLNANSELELPEVEESSQGTGATIRFGKTTQLPSPPDPVPHWSWGGEHSVVVHWDDVGTFEIRDGREIILEPDPTAAEYRIRLFLLGAAMGVLLHQRGYTVLHGSATHVDDGVVVFLGAKGWGKSTMVATLHAMGYSLLADDVVAIDTAHDRPLVLPGFPQLKLWPDALASIGQRSETLPRLHPDYEKRSYRLDSGFSGHKGYLKHIYLLDHGPTPVVEAVRPNEALLELLPHWYCGRFSSQVLQHLGPQTRFLQCADLAKRVPIYRLKRPRSMASLSETAQMVIDHCAAAPEHCSSHRPS